MPFKPTVMNQELPFRLLLEDCNQGVLVHIHGVPLFANQAVATIFGFDTPEQILDLSSTTALYAEGEHKRILTYSELRNAGHDVPERYVTEGRRRDGREIWVEQTVTPVHWQGQVWMQCMLSDVTERLRAEEAVRDSEQRFRTVAENAPSAITVKDLAGRITLANQLACDWYGVSEEQILGKTLSELAPAETAEELAEMDRAVLDTGQPQYIEQQFRFSDEDPRWVQTVKSPIVERSGQITGILTIGTDVTAFRKMERALQQTQKLEALGQMTGGIAHDFNNILASILGFAALAQLRPALTTDGRLSAHLQEIINAGKRGRDLVAQMLAFARPSETERNPVAVGPVVEEAVALVIATFPATVNVYGSFAATKHRAAVDTSELHQLVMNLCLNSRDAIDGKGEISVGVREVELDKQLCNSCKSEITGTFVEVCVGDHGTGIDADTLDRIFDPFYTTKPVGVGSGLGLSMVHGVTHAHGGHIVVDTVPGQHTNFCVYFPVATPDKAVAPSRRDAETQTRSPRAGAILVLDDEPSISRFLSELLEVAGHNPTVCLSGAQLLEKVAATPDAFDMVITDQTMPEMTGTEVAKALSEMAPDLPVVICSGYPDINVQLDDRQRIRAVLKKPLDNQELLDVVAEILAPD
ncbi:MAG: PAS domain S-box protein [Gammaproteobacteria bacterium]|nr:PAS domain S-box protein [Gammaproteobacteria bacterium]